MPFHKCQRAVNEDPSLGGRVVMHDNRDGAAAALGMTAENSLLVYDMVRCARCPLPVVPARAADPSSSFLHAIELLHARLHARAATAMSGMRDIRR